MDDSETGIDPGDGGTATLIAVVLVVALLAIGLFYYFGLLHSGG